jgi:hypothetical protein
MSNKTDRVTPWVQVAAVSLVALVACALANDARAIPTEPSVGGKLSTSIAAITERVRAGEPTLLPRLPPKPKMAWRN